VTPDGEKWVQIACQTAEFEQNRGLVWSANSAVVGKFRGKSGKFLPKRGHFLASSANSAARQAAPGPKTRPAPASRMAEFRPETARLAPIVALVAVPLPRGADRRACAKSVINRPAPKPSKAKLCYTLRMANTPAHSAGRYGRQLGTTAKTLRQALESLAPDAPAVAAFAARRASYLDLAGMRFLEIQLRATEAINRMMDEGLLNGWQLIEAVKAFGIAGDYAHKQMRLERGESTENTALVSKVIMGVHTKRGYTPAGYPDAASPSASPHEPSDQKTGGQGGTGNQG
jgi:hypothetical protein